ncbi:Hypothetical predicted protein [Olea europaea subsp. europaea]|uniref:Uncharacterized protein n=1 Tax=Olea europaea subsp. europaea TaxID=158383 RepID=A0A8S0PKF3_OLEEU|nr:Hypothetical predicted protein [Olea europaea subsp. europaea]
MMFPSVEDLVKAHRQLDFTCRGATSCSFRAALPQCNDAVVRRGGWLWQNGLWVEEGEVVVEQKRGYATSSELSQGVSRVAATSMRWCCVVVAGHGAWNWDNGGEVVVTTDIGGRQ